MEHEILTSYEKWKKEHPDTDYQCDEIGEFVNNFDRASLHSLLEFSIKQRDELKEFKKMLDNPELIADYLGGI